MNVLGKTLGFSLGMILIFTLVANLLPQVEGEAPVEQKVDLGALTMESYIALGEALFSGKGTCTLCHNAMGRAPDLLVMNVGGAAEKHLEDERYKGKATNIEEYLHESMVDPGAFVVASFGKKGSNDTESPMPAVNKAPIELSEIEINAIIAFLQFKDGNDVTVELPTEAPPVEAAPAAGSAPAPAATAEDAIKKYGCQACHSMLGTESSVGPALDGIGSRQSAEQISLSITDPAAAIAEGFTPGVMPADFAEKMTVKELKMIIDLLLEQR
ncbi:MAG: c-type cytochrome [Candidatus Polarisedimenticolaceae bacterium]|nr:c-type cytochrome [Candidatus Polarisedimenticolaceae bacterium]